MKKRAWYVLRVRGRQEEKIGQAIRQAMTDAGFEQFLGGMHIPSHRFYTLKEGKRVVKKAAFAYLTLELDLSKGGVQEVVMRVAGVMGFVSPAGWNSLEQPIPLSQAEVDNMLGRAQEEAQDREGASDTLEIGDQVEVIDGAFQGSIATIRQIDRRKQRVSVALRLFKKESEISLHYNQIRKR